MGIRIDIEWNFTSPVLQRASGIIKIWKIDQELLESNPPELIFQCRCRVERGSMGFTGITEGESFSSRLLTIYDNQIKTLMRSYYDGMLLRDKQYHWVEESLHGDKMFEDWETMQLQTQPYRGA
jgi:hypothetical protein